jgi:lysozyme family protein
MAKFSESHHLTAKEEGGFSSRSKDPGGYTYKGISKQSHPNFPGWPLVARWVSKYGGPAKAYNRVFPDPVLDKMIADYFEKKFYTPNKIDKINDQFVANHVYDFCVNSGSGPLIINRAFGYSGLLIKQETVDAINNMVPEEANTIIYNARKSFVYSLTMKINGRKVSVVSQNRGLKDRIERYKNWEDLGSDANNYYDFQTFPISTSQKQYFPVN